jgi:hypothetical protein
MKWEDGCMGNYSYLKVGFFEISCIPGRTYQDGTKQYMIYLRVPNADSREIITLTKARGHLDDAKAVAERWIMELMEVV